MKIEDAANMLHHLSMLYVGSFAELCKGERIGILPHDYPGLKDVRDLIDQVLFCRAEVSAMTQLLRDAKLLTADQATAVMAENYEWFAREKIKRWPGYRLTEYGISIDVQAATAPPHEKN